MKNPRTTKIALAIGAPLLALIAAFLITSLVLIVADLVVPLHLPT